MRPPRPTGARSEDGPKRPTASQCASVLLHVFALTDKSRNKSGRKPLTRAKLSQGMLKELWKRPRLTPEFVQEVSDWLVGAGWVLFYAGRIYGAVRVSAVVNWPRVSANPLPAQEREKIAAGNYDYSPHYSLLLPEGPDHDSGGDDEE
jgi:hypothetical protein